MWHYNVDSLFKQIEIIRAMNLRQSTKWVHNCKSCCPILVLYQKVKTHVCFLFESFSLVGCWNNDVLWWFKHVYSMLTKTKSNFLSARFSSKHSPINRTSKKEARPWFLFFQFPCFLFTDIFPFTTPSIFLVIAPLNGLESWYSFPKYSSNPDHFIQNQANP